MKKIFTLFALFAMVLGSMAQTQYFYEWKGSKLVVRTTEELDSITFDIPEDAVILTTGDPISVTKTSMTASYTLTTVLDIAQSSCTQGVCYSANANPTADDSCVLLDGFSVGQWSVTIADLNPGTTYYYCSFLKFGGEAFYGEVKSFTTAGGNEWKSLGKGKFCDAFLGDEGEYMNVEIQQRTSQPNFFRLVEPYAGILGDIAVDEYLEFAILPAGSKFEDYTLDAEYVVFNNYNMGQWNSNYPEDIYAMHPYRFGRTPDKWTYNVVLDYQENGLPGEVSLAPIYYLFEEAGGWDRSEANTISILFPGYVKKDYSASVQFVETVKVNNSTACAVANLTLGADATNVKAVVMPQDVELTAVVDAIAEGSLEATSVSAGRIEVPFNAEELGGSNFQIIVVVLADGAVKTVATTSFNYYFNGNPWKSLGTGYYTDDVILPMFYKNGTPVTYEVEILEHSENPGLYRIMNPYAKSVHPAGDDDYAPEGMYIEVNATDAEGVYIQQQSLGMDWGYGEMSLVSYGATYFSKYPFETVKGAGYLGKVVDGVITFPAFTQSNGKTLQGILYMGSDGYLAGMNSKMEIVLPGSNAFARNMAKAQAKVTAQKLKKMDLSSLKVEKIRKVIFSRKVEGSFKL